LDGHDVNALRAALTQVPFDAQRPSAIICHTVKGRGIPFMEGNLAWHHKTRVTDEEVQSLMNALEIA